MSAYYPLNWQPDYGPYALWQSLAEAIDSLKYEPQRLLIIYAADNNKGPADVLGTYAFRARPENGIPLAIGAVTANPALKVVVIVPSHFVFAHQSGLLSSATRQNHNITIISLQSADPTSSHPGLTALLTEQPNLVARTWIPDPRQMKSIFQVGLKQDGLSFIEVLAPAQSSAATSYAALRLRVFPLQIGDGQADWPADDAAKAIARLQQTGPRLDTGVLFQAKRRSIQSQMLQRNGQPLVDQALKPLNAKQLLARIATLDPETE